MTETDRQTFLVNFAKYLDSMHVEKQVRFTKLMTIKECMKTCDGWDRAVLDNKFDLAVNIYHTFECQVFLPKGVN